MKNVIKTVKTLELIWPIWTSAVIVCRILDRLEEGVIEYWEPYWDAEKDEIGIRFASEEGVIETLPGSVVRFVAGSAVSKRKPGHRENDPATRIDEKKRAVAYVYDPGIIEDLRALSESGHTVELHETGTFVHDGGNVVRVSGGWVIEDADTRRIRVEHGAVDPDDIAEELGGELV